MAEPDCLQPREFVATPGAADEGRHLVADQLAAAVGENRRTAHQTCALLLVAVGRGASDPAVVCWHAAEDHGAAVAGWMRQVQSGSDFDDDAGAQGEVSAEPLGKRDISGRCVPTRCETGPSPRRWKHCGPKPAKTLQRKAVPSMRGGDFAARGVTDIDLASPLLDRLVFAISLVLPVTLDGTFDQAEEGASS